MATADTITAFLAEPRNVLLVGVRVDGRPHATPNWFVWDGAQFYISTTRTRAKYRIFQRDPRAQLVVDDATGFRCVLLDGQVVIREDLAAELPHFGAIRAKYGVAVPSEAEHLAVLTAEERVLLVITPDAPLHRWTTWGLE